MYSACTSGDRLLSLWYTNPPFRMHHPAKCTVELEWDKEQIDDNQEVFKFIITYQLDGSYLIEVMITTQKQGADASFFLKFDFCLFFDLCIKNYCGGVRRLAYKCLVYGEEHNIVIKIDNCS